MTLIFADYFLIEAMWKLQGRENQAFDDMDEIAITDLL